MNDIEEKGERPVELPSEKTITLRKTISIGNGADQVQYDEITLREPTVNEIEQFIKKLKSTNEIDAMKFFIALVSGVLPSVIGQMGARDWNEAQEFIQAFFPSGGSLATGNS